MSDTLAAQHAALDPRLERKLRAVDTLPSPPGVAAQLVEMSQDPSIGMTEVAAIVELDPAVTAKILKTANSPAYSRARQTENLAQAVTLLGLNETLSMALSFSLVNSLHSEDKSGLNFPMFWRRSLGIATFARVLARQTKTGDLDRYFLCGLLQDIGMLAVNEAFPKVYAGIGGAQIDHDAVCTRERRRIDAEHSAIGAWLLDQWAFPEHFYYATLCSHDGQSSDTPSELSQLTNHIYIAQLVGDCWWRRDWGDCARRGASACENLLGLPQSAFLEALEAQASLLRETASIFDIKLGDTNAMELIVEQAAQALDTPTLFGATALIESPPPDTDDALTERYDELTGVYSRDYITYLQQQAFKGSLTSGIPLSLLVVELDNFASVIELIGAKSDNIVRLIGAALSKAVRKTDIVGRYEQSRFVVYLPSTPLDGAKIFAQRLQDLIRKLGSSPALSTLSITASIGLAASTLPNIENDQALSACAIDALEQAQREGGDTLIIASSGSTELSDDDDDTELEFEVPDVCSSSGDVIQLA